MVRSQPTTATGKKICEGNKQLSQMDLRSFGKLEKNMSFSWWCSKTCASDPPLDLEYNHFFFQVTGAGFNYCNWGNWLHLWSQQEWIVAFERDNWHFDSLFNCQLTQLNPHSLTRSESACFVFWLAGSCGLQLQHWQLLPGVAVHSSSYHCGQQMPVGVLVLPLAPGLLDMATVAMGAMDLLEQSLPLVCCWLCNVCWDCCKWWLCSLLCSLQLQDTGHTAAFCCCHYKTFLCCLLLIILRHCCCF